MITNSRKIKEGDASEDNPKSLGDIAPNPEAIELAERGVDADYKLDRIDHKNIFWWSRKTGSGVFLAPNGRKGYQGLTSSDLDLTLSVCGFEDLRPTAIQNNDSKISAFKYLKVCIQQHQNVDFAGPLAGHKSGLKHFGNTRALVTSEAVHVEPKEGNFSFIDNHLRQMFGSDEQINYLYGWIQKSLVDVRSGSITTGLVMAVSGPPGCGKSLFKDMIGKMLGGRIAKAGRYLKESTDFNADLCACELWVLDDEISPKKFNDRERLAQCVKQIAADRMESVHDKHATAFTVPIWRRLLICTNDKIESLRILPPVGMDGVSDKLLIFKAHVFELPPLLSPEDEDRFWEQYDKALPGFIHYILNEWKTPDEIKSDRWGVTSYISPDIYETLLEDQPETRFHAYIQHWLRDTGKSTHKSEAKVLLDALENYGGNTSSFNELHLSTVSIGRNVEKLNKRDGKFSEAYQKGRSKERWIQVSIMDE
jgi:hypothetical protein